MYRDFLNLQQDKHDVHAHTRPDSFAKVPPLSSRNATRPLMHIPVPFDASSSFVGDETKAYDGSAFFGPHDSMMELTPLGPNAGEETWSRPRHKHVRRSCTTWLRGEWGMCGWFTRGTAVILGFVGLALFIVLIYFVVPRVPSVRLVTQHALTPATQKSDMQLLSSPLGFRMNGTLHLRLDNSDGWIPSHLLSLDTEVQLSKTKTVIGKGHAQSQWIPGRQVSRVNVPVTFAHKSLNESGDATQLAIQDACAHLYRGVQRPSMCLLY